MAYKVILVGRECKVKYAALSVAAYGIQCGTPWQLAYGILPGILGIPPHLTPQVPRNKGRVQQVPGTYGRYSCVTIFSGSLYTLHWDLNVVIV